MQRSQAEAKRAAFLNPEEKEGEKSERDLSRQRGGGGREKKGFRKRERDIERDLLRYRCAHAHLEVSTC